MKQKLRAQVKIEGDDLAYQNVQRGLEWQIPISAIVLIAEYTTDEGPWIDDYFLDFWSCLQGQLLLSTATFYSEGIDEAMEILSRKLCSELKLALCDSTQWKSRVIWPAELASHPYFACREIPAKTWREQLRRRILGPRFEYVPSEEVQASLRRHSQSS